MEGVWAVTRDLQQSYPLAAGDEVVGGGVTAVLHTSEGLMWRQRPALCHSVGPGLRLIRGRYRQADFGVRQGKTF